jgi:hypothetical protein
MEDHKSLLALKGIWSISQNLQEQVVSGLKSGEGYLSTLVGPEQWDELRFLRYMEALSSAGEEFRTPSQRMQGI